MRSRKWQFAMSLVVGAVVVAVGRQAIWPAVAARDSTRDVMHGSELQALIDRAWQERRYLVELPPGIATINVSETLINPGVGLRPGRDQAAVRLVWTGGDDGLIMRCHWLTNQADAYGHPPRNPVETFLAISDLFFDGRGRARAIDSPGGFREGATLARCFFFRCTGPVVRLADCWGANVEDLAFYGNRGEHLVMTQHSIGRVRNVRLLTGGPQSADDRAAVVLSGAAARWEGFQLEGTHFPNRPSILIEGSSCSVLAQVRCESGENGVLHEAAILARNCSGCRFEQIHGGSEWGETESDTHAQATVRLIGGEKNVVQQITDGRWRSLAPGGAIVQHAGGADFRIEQLWNQSLDLPKEHHLRPDVKPFRPERDR